MKIIFSCMTTTIASKAAVKRGGQRGRRKKGYTTTIVNKGTDAALCCPMWDRMVHTGCHCLESKRVTAACTSCEGGWVEGRKKVGQRGQGGNGLRHHKCQQMLLFAALCGTEWRRRGAIAWGDGCMHQLQVGKGGWTEAGKESENV